jgi:phosphoglycolate phosphatase
MTTLLFDIDGTLIRTNGSGKAAMEAALRTAFGVTEIHDNVPYGGRTDPAIGRDLLSVHGLEPTQANYEKLSAAYLAHLPQCLQQYGGQPCPGVVELLESLAARPVRLGLLTGNVRRGAQTKLSHFDLWTRFAFGGFGDEHHDRDDVARSALVAAGDVNTDRVWVIGDTPLDVKCARAIGAKVIAVATGWTSYDELHTHAPDLTLHDLRDHTRLFDVWFD